MVFAVFEKRNGVRSDMQQNPSAHSGRFLFLNLFRGAFAIVMLEGHTFRALLDASFKAGAVYQYHELVHNLTGPAFLFASGVAFSLATLSRWESYRTWSRQFARRLIRFLSLLLLGYALHLTYFSLRRTVGEGTPEQFSSLMSMDILQCIAASGLLLQLLVMILPGPRWFFAAAAAGCVVIGLTSPFVWGASHHFPFWLGTSLSGKWGSVYPFFPYAGFQLAGAAWGYLFVQAGRQEAESGFLRLSRRYFTWLVLGCLTASFLPMPHLYSDYWNTGPAFYFLRVGILCLLVIPFRLAESRLESHLGVMSLIGKESLVVYVSHLLLLHGSAFNPDRNILKLLGTAQNPVHTTLVLLLLLSSMIALSWTWSRLKNDHNWKARGLQLTLAGYLFYAFASG